MNSLESRVDEFLGFGNDVIQDVPEGEYIERAPVTEVKMEIAIIPSEFDDASKTSDIMYDYIKSRNTLHTLLERSTTALEGAMKVAVETESPRGYEVVKQLIEASKELSKDILSLHKQCKEIKKIERTTPDIKSEAGQAGQIVEEEEGTFNGSTKDLLTFIKQLKDDSV